MGPNNRDRCIQFLQADERRNWKEAKIILFDAPKDADKPYSKRLELLRQSMTVISFCTKIFRNTGGSLRIIRREANSVPK
jgi:hypothetical protein